MKPKSQTTLILPSAVSYTPPGPLIPFHRPTLNIALRLESIGAGDTNHAGFNAARGIFQLGGVKTWRIILGCNITRRIFMREITLRQRSGAGDAEEGSEG